MKRSGRWPCLSCAVPRFLTAVGIAYVPQSRFRTGSAGLGPGLGHYIHSRSFLLEGAAHGTNGRAARVSPGFPALVGGGAERGGVPWWSRRGSSAPPGGPGCPFPFGGSSSLPPSKVRILTRVRMRITWVKSPVRSPVMRATQTTILTVLRLGEIWRIPKRFVPPGFSVAVG